ncbi:MAG: insulinase family protein [Bacteroidota bacterium]
MKIMNVVLAGGLLMALGIPALAQKQTPPEGGTPKDFTVPAKQTFKLTNGLEAVLVPYGSLPKVTISVRVRVGNVNESAQQVWLADIMGDLMKEGTTSRSAQAVAEEAAGMGGSVNIGVSDDQTNINGTALSEF